MKHNAKNEKKNEERKEYNRKSRSRRMTNTLVHSADKAQKLTNIKLFQQKKNLQ